MNYNRAAVDSRGVKHADPTCQLQFTPGDINFKSIGHGDGDYYCSVCCVEYITDVK